MPKYAEIREFIEEHELRCGDIKIAVAIIEQLMADNAWVSVEERLPETVEGTGSKSSEYVWCRNFTEIDRYVAVKAWYSPYYKTWTDIHGNQIRATGWKPITAPRKE